MIIDFKTTSGKVFFNEYVAPYSFYIIKLKSRYSNKYLTIFSNNDYLPVTIDENYDTWCSFDYTLFDDTITNTDVGGYYDMELYGTNTTFEEGVLLRKELCRLINNFTEGISTPYISDNEDNEEKIYYRR